jgi:hypothetical protein
MRHRRPAACEFVIAAVLPRTVTRTAFSALPNVTVISADELLKNRPGRACRKRSAPKICTKITWLPDCPLISWRSAYKPITPLPFVLVQHSPESNFRISNRMQQRRYSFKSLAMNKHLA